MRFFSAIVAGGRADIQKALADDGFLLAPPDRFDGEDRFCCAVTDGAANNDLVCQKWRPKLIFSGSKEGKYSGIYSWQAHQAGGVIYLGVLPDTPFLFPDDWYLDYGVDKNDLPVFLKALADYSYRYLLKEAMAENAEWCGHMSSVVHRL